MRAQSVMEPTKDNASASATMERRRRMRTKTHWPVLLLRSRAGEVIDSATLNLSSLGFCCLSATLLSIGEPLTCWLKIPAHEPADPDRTLSLECKVRVVRAEPATVEGYFEIACRIDDYRLHAEDAGPSWQPPFGAAEPSA